MRSASATEVPPNFMTTVFEPATDMAPNDSPSRSAQAPGVPGARRCQVPFAPVRAQFGRRRLVLALLVALAVAAGAAGVVVGAGGDDDDDEPAPGVPSAGRDAPRERISFLAKLVPAPAGPARRGRSPVPRSVAELARRLPLERKVAQLFLVGFSGTDLTAQIFGRLRRRDLGGIVFAAPNYLDQTQLTAMTGEAAVIARDEGHVPPWVFTTQEGGELNSFPDVPPFAAPADLPSANDAEAEVAASAAALRGLGVTGVLGPVVDVGTATGSVLGARVYSDDPEQVAAYAEATVLAYRDEHVFSAVKHFPGLGAADQSTEEGPASVGLGVDELRERDLVPFEAAVKAGVPGVVLGHALYPFSDFTVPASLSRQTATDLLRGQLRFRGVAITDDLADPAITTIYSVPDAAVRAVRAGADMLYISGAVGDQEAAYVAVLRAVRRGSIPRRRLDQAVGRVLFAKQDYDLIR
jgi:beta-N-acetylhexosaminidase